MSNKLKENTKISRQHPDLIKEINLIKAETGKKLSEASKEAAKILKEARKKSRRITFNDLFE